MGRPKSGPSEDIAKKIISFLPEDGREVYWKDLEEAAIKTGMSTRTLLKYTLDLENAGKIIKRLDPNSRRPRYLYSRVTKDERKGLAETKVIIDTIQAAAQKLRTVNTYEEKHKIVTALFNSILPQISNDIAWIASDYNSHENKKDAEAFRAMAIKLDLIPIINELTEALPKLPLSRDYPITWSSAVLEVIRDVVDPNLPKINEVLKKDCTE